MHSASEPQTIDANYSTNRKLIIIMYALYIASPFIGFTWVVALIMYFVKRSEIQDHVLVSHLRWQIRSFVITLIIGLIGAVLALVAIGYVVLLLLSLWYLYRMIRGVLALIDNKSMPI